MFRDGFTRLVDLGLRGGDPFKKKKLLAICGGRLSLRGSSDSVVLGRCGQWYNWSL